MTRRVISKQVNAKGTPFALTDNGDSTWSVFQLCSNYDGHVRGGIRKTWRACAPTRNAPYTAIYMNEDIARDLFARRIKGTAR